MILLLDTEKGQITQMIQWSPHSVHLISRLHLKNPKQLDFVHGGNLLLTDLLGKWSWSCSTFISFKDSKSFSDWPSKIISSITWSSNLMRHSTTLPLWISLGSSKYFTVCLLITSGSVGPIETYIYMWQLYASLSACFHLAWMGGVRNMLCSDSLLRTSFSLLFRM